MGNTYIFEVLFYVFRRLLTTRLLSDCDPSFVNDVASLGLDLGDRLFELVGF